MPTENQKCCFEFLDCMLIGNLTAFTRAIMHAKQYGGFLCLCHLIKVKEINVSLNQIGRLYNSNKYLMPGHFYAIYTRQKFFHNAHAFFARHT